MKRNRFILIIVCIAVALCASVLAACSFDGYTGGREVPDATRNEVLFIEQNRLSFALGMEIDDKEVIEKCNCKFTAADGSVFTVTAKSLERGEVKYESFDLETVGSNKQIRIAYNNAVNYIYYDVNDYTANFYLDEEMTELYKTVKASARLTDTLGLSVWVNLIQYNYSTDEVMREHDESRTIRFNGWYDSSENPATGLYPLSLPQDGNERTINFHARYITEDELSHLRLSYDNSGRRVFSGYTGEGDSVTVPEGVTYIDLAQLFHGGSSFKSLHIPSTVQLAPLVTAVNSVGLEEITVDEGNLDYASYNGAIYSKDFSTMYFMPSDCKNTDFHSELAEFGMCSCAYWRVPEIEMPESVITLQHYCFAYSLIKNVHNLANVKIINTGCFFGSQIEMFTDGIARYIILDGEYSNQYVLSMILDTTITEYKVVDGTIGIAGSVFSRCDDLKSIDLGTELKGIGASAFSGCASLESINLPASLKTMGTKVFYGCTSLKSVTGLTDVKYIDSDGGEFPHTVPSYLFYGCTSLKSVTLPEGVVQIASNAFNGCSNLETIEIPDTVTRISIGAFQRCSSLKSISLPSSLRSLGDYAFSSSGIESIDLSDCKNLTSLSEHCFRSSKIQEIILPDSITTIPYRCFYLATSLKSISLDNVKVLEDEVFAGCTALDGIDLGIVESIGYRTFQQCNKFTSVVLPDSVKYVGGYAFQSCANLASLTFGKNVQTFGSYEFSDGKEVFGTVEPAVYNCKKLKEINVVEGNPYFKSIGGVLYGRSVCGIDYGEASVLYSVPPAYAKTSFVSADSTRVIVPYALHYQTNLTTASFNEGLENIGKGAFYASTKLTSVHLPSSVTYIGASILLSCSKVKTFTIAEGSKSYTSDGNLLYKDDVLVMYLQLSNTIDIKDGITKIDMAVFMNSTKLTEVTIPDSVVEIGEKAFNGCSNIKSIHLGSGLRYLDPTAFGFLKSLETITVSEDNPYFEAENNILYTKGGKSLVLAAANNGMTELDIKDGVTEIWDYAFSYHKTLKSAHLPEGVKTVGDYAFYECRGIEYLVCSESLESIGKYAFSFDSANAVDAGTNRLCDTLKFVILYGNLKSIGDFAFHGQFGIEYTYFKMTYSQLSSVLSGVGKNSIFLTRGCKDDKGGYYNNDGQGIVRALYSASEPVIDYEGYEWFYFDGDTPKLYSLTRTVKTV